MIFRILRGVDQRRTGNPSGRPSGSVTRALVHESQSTGPIQPKARCCVAVNRDLYPLTAL